MKRGRGFLPAHCWTNKAYAANDCSKHALEGGTHYLSPLQVEFVNAFKDLEVRRG